MPIPSKSNTSQLCSVSELSSILKSERLRLLDCSWYLPSQNRNHAREFNERHISNAQFFDIDAVCDLNNPLPHMLPSAESFAETARDLGINQNSRVVVYDSAGLFSAARVWWMFKIFGLDSIQVLNGGLPAWLAENGQTDHSSNQSKISKKTKGDFHANLDPQLVASKEQLIANIESNTYTVLDARPTNRFLGKAPEPRPALPSGHMPNSLSIPIDQLVEKGKLKTNDKLHKIFTSIGVDKDTNIVTSCGSGVTAAIICLALYEIGYGLKPLYDGSWAEWGSASDTIILNRYGHEPS